MSLPTKRGTQPFQYAGNIDQDVTINVAPSGGDFTTLTEALAYVSNYKLTTSGSLTIQVADGTYDESNLSLPNLGKRYTLIGNSTNPENCVLSINTPYGGFKSEGADCEIKGFTIRNLLPAGRAVEAYSGGFIVLENVTIGMGSLCDLGIIAASSAAIRLSGKINISRTTNGNSRPGVYASNCGMITIWGAVTSISRFYDGLYAGDGSHVRIGAGGSITITSCTFGYKAIANSQINLYNVTYSASGNTTNYSPAIDTQGNGFASIVNT